MPVVRPPITGSLALDSWTDQVTRHINTDLGSGIESSAATGAGSVGAAGADGASAPHYAEITLFTDPAVGSLPSAPTATMTWTTGALSSVTAGWSQTSPAVNPVSPDNVYSSKIIFIDTIAPFATTTATGTTPVKSLELTSLAAITVDNTAYDANGDLVITLQDASTVTSVLPAGQGIVYVQDAQPTSTNPYLWVQTNVNTDGDFSFWFTE